MKWMFVLMTVWLIAPPPVFAQVDDPVLEFTHTQPRGWADSTGQHEMQGRLVARNLATKSVKLERADGSSLDVALDKLGNSDRNYVARQTAKLQRSSQRKKTPNHASDGDASRLGQATPIEKEVTPAETRRLSGIDWHTDPALASQAATGGAVTSDDRPIIWFRVLGELEGYM